MNDYLVSVSILCLIILVLIILLRRLNQPYPVAYVVAGIVLGPGVAKVFIQADEVTRLGQFGILFLMFFLGIELEVPDNRNFLFKPVIIQFVKTVLTAILSGLIGWWLHWQLSQMIVLCAVLLFNSTAVISELLHHNSETDSTLGRLVLSVLILQDVLVAPVLTVFNSLDSPQSHFLRIIISVATCILLGILLKKVRDRVLFRLPEDWKQIQKDHDIQVFAAALICLGFACVAVWIGFPPSLGSFAAGAFLRQTPVFNWFRKALRPFKVFFVALFFVAIGVSVDFPFLIHHFVLILLTGLSLLLITTLITATVFRIMDYPWRDSVYGGGLLSGTGELGLLIVAGAREAGLISPDFFKMSLGVISITLLLSSAWITVVRKITHIFPIKALRQ